MRMQKPRWVVFAALAALALTTGLRAANPVPTTITIPDMECKGCARMVTTSLLAVPGVASVQTDVKARKAVAQPKPQTVLSPRALWEALEKIDKEPSRLEGPNGTFTAKPQS